MEIAFNWLKRSEGGRMTGDIRNFFTLGCVRASGEMVEVSEIADEVGFGIPMFFSNDLAAELGCGRARRNVLTFLFYLAQGHDSQHVVLSYASENRGRLEIIATLFVPDEGPFVILALYDEVRDILEGLPE